MPRYTPEEQKKAYIAYKEFRSLSKVSEIMRIPLTTISKWSVKFDWVNKLEEEQKTLIPKPIDHELEVKKLAKKFNISEQDAETLNQIKTIESVVFSSIYKRPEEEEDPILLRPLSFDSAMRALKTCWDARNKLFSESKITDSHDNPKINYIAQVVNYNTNKKDDATIIDVPKAELPEAK